MPDSGCVGYAATPEVLRAGGLIVNLRASSKVKGQLGLFVGGVFGVTAQAQSDPV